MNLPKISVLMPVYNSRQFLKEAIDSILNQTYTDFEFLIINDASTDNSKEIILAYNDKRIRYFENERNIGVAKTLNLGLKIARAPLIARMDADDVSLPNRLKLQYQKMKSDKQIAVLASDFAVLIDNGKLSYIHDQAKTPEEIYYTLQFRNCLGHPTIMFRKSVVFDILKGYDIKRESEDYDCWLRIASRYKISKINTCLLKLRTSKNSRMGAMSKKLNEDAISLAKKNLEYLTNEKISDDTIEILRINFTLFKTRSCTKYSKEKIRKALKILEKANVEILNRYPPFLERSILEKISTSKVRSLKHELSVSTLFDLRVGFFLKLLFKFYFYFEKRITILSHRSEEISNAN